MLVRFNKRTIIGGTIYTPESGEVELANDIADQVVAAGNGVVVGFGAYSNEARIATDANGNTTGLAGYLDGFLTVGVNGAFPTIQAAVDSITTADCFTALTTTGYPATANVWLQGTSGIETSAYSMSAVNLDPPFMRNRTWLQVAGDTRLYPVENFSSYGLDVVEVKVPRIEADLAAPAALTFYRETPVTILLLDSAIKEDVVIPNGISVRFVSLNGTRWTEDYNATAGGHGTIFADTSHEYGSIRVGAGVEIEGSVNLLTSATSGQFFLDPGSKYGCVLSDGFTLNVWGTIEFDRTNLHQSAVTGLSHFFQGELRGDFVVKDSGMDMFVMDSLTTIQLRPWDSHKSRRVVVDGLRVMLNDPNGRIDGVVLFPSNYSSTGEYSLRGISVSAMQSLNCYAYIVDEGTGAIVLTNSFTLEDCHINDTRIAGAKYIFKTSTGGSARVVKATNCSGGIIQKPSTGSLTVGSQGVGAGSTGAGSAALGGNCPAATPTAPNTWKAVTLDDGTTGYIPVWK